MGFDEEMSSSDIPEKCPKCGGRVAEIAYGLLSLDGEDVAKKNGMFMGGCCVGEDSPTHICTKCYEEFGRMKDRARSMSR